MSLCACAGLTRSSSSRVLRCGVLKFLCKERMSSGGETVVRLHDQLRAVWKKRVCGVANGSGEGRVPDAAVPVRGYLHNSASSPHGKASFPGDISERWFYLLGHCFFYTIHRDSPEFSGALLADIFETVNTTGCDGSSTTSAVYSKSPSASQVRLCNNYQPLVYYT